MSKCELIRRRVQKLRDFAVSENEVCRVPKGGLARDTCDLLATGLDVVYPVFGLARGRRSA
jgi:hypothetical protein